MTALRALVGVGGAALTVAACTGAPGSSASGPCLDCSIFLTRGPTIGQLDGPGELSGDPPVGRDSRGRIYVAGFANGGILVFDSTGAYARTIGRRGPGPGEFEVVSAIVVAPADTVLVFDRRNRRVTVLSPEHDVARMASITDAPFPARHALLPNGKSVVASVSWTRDGVGQPLSVLDVNFNVERAFGAAGHALDSNDQPANVRLVTPADSAEVWAGRPREYLLELWSTDGSRIREIRRTADWLPPVQPERPWRDGDPMPRSHPLIVNIQADPDGFIWVLGTVADTGWKAAELVRVPAGMKPVGEQPADDQYDTMIEVVDAATGQLVASLRHPLYFNQFASSRTLVHREEREDGRFLMTTYKLQLATR
jgi:hypothetical protein